MSRLKELRKVVDAELMQMEKPDKRIGAVNHLYGVSLAATMIAKKRGLDPELAAMAAMMHDLAAYKSGSYDDHAHRGAELARGILADLGLTSEEETELICSAIYHHDDKLVVDGPMDEVLKDADDMQTAVKALIKDTLTAHRRIIFNGDNYSDEWVAEAERRGLLNLKSLPEALSHFLDQKNIDLFVKHNICTEAELRARCEIDLEAYSKQLNIEALTMADMAKKEILPAVMRYTGDLAAALNEKKAAMPELSYPVESELIKKLTELVVKIDAAGKALEKSIAACEAGDATEQAFRIRDELLPRMAELRAPCDEAETMTAADYWPFPTYGDLLFGV